MWLTQYMIAKKLEASDRNIHELRVLVDVLHFGGTVDQLNVGSIVAFEVVTRRIGTICDPIGNGVGKPNWNRAKHFSGTGSIDDGIPPAMRAHVARKQREDRESRIVVGQMPRLEPMVTGLMAPFPIPQRKAVDGEGRGND